MYKLYTFNIYFKILNKISNYKKYVKMDQPPADYN